ncbi:MAG: protein of unknown function Spy-related protein [Gemmatimonadetes bacterium]|nr:protein of unknown function Spy-related protein [Gemmatimonadota bacterium]
MHFHGPAGARGRMTSRSNEEQSFTLEETIMKAHGVITGLALALTLGSAGVAAAQSAHQPDQARAAQDSGRKHGPGRGRENLLLRGITLTSAQQTQLKTLAEAQRREFGGKRQQGDRPVRGDTTGMGARRAEMEKHREQHIASVRAILDASQRAQLDKNIAEMKAHRRG